ncbi:MAG: hypothetical protein ACYDAD_01065 [Acidimicrobiales bacterium]
MGKRRATVELDERLVAAARAEAARTGRTESDVIEDALEKQLGARRPSVVDEVWARNAANALSEDEAMALAMSELKAARGERQNGAGDKAAC